MIEQKTKEISASMGEILHGQLEVLNETMRKIEIKENNLKGKRIYDYSKQVENIKSSVSGVVDAIKEQGVNKMACNELILDEAKCIKEKVLGI